MSLPEEDVAARGRSIFERLRAEQEAVAAEVTEAPTTADEPEDVPTAGSGEAVVRWAALPLAGEPSSAPPERVGAIAGASPDPDPSATERPLAEEARTEAPPPAAASAAAVVPEELLPAEPGALEDAPQPEEVVQEAPVAPDAPPPPERAARAARFTAAPPVMPALPTLAPGALAGDAPGDVVEAAAGDPAPGAPEVSATTSAFARDLPRTIAVANQKGGVGKTTTTVNLGASLAVLGYRVLVVDLDPQGNATTGLGINSRNLEHSIYDVILHDVAMDDCIEPTSLRNLYVAPATIDLAGAEIELVPAFSRELRLKRALDEVRDDFDFVLIDCPPSLGLLTVNGLAAANEVLVPIQCEYYALEGLGQLLRNVNLVQSNLNPQLEMSAIVLTMYDARTKLADQVAAEVRTHFGPRVCRNIIPRTVRLSEAPSFGQPIIVFDPTSRGALAYRELAKEVSGGTPQRVG